MVNPHKCIFCVKTGILLSFIISKDDIHIDPLKIEAILALPMPTNITELQSLQEKEFFYIGSSVTMLEKLMVSCVY